MLVKCLHRCPIIYTTMCERHFYYMESGIQPNLQRQWVYYDVSELTSDALYIRPHQISFMDDGWSERRSAILIFFSKNWFFAKRGQAKKLFLFSKKETLNWRDFQAEKKLVSPNKNGTAK